MPARNTSKAAFISINESGCAKAIRRRVLAILTCFPGLTCLEIFLLVRKEFSTHGNEIQYGTVSGRCRELKAAKLIHEDGCKHNPGTNKSANRLYVGAAKND